MNAPVQEWLKLAALTTGTVSPDHHRKQLAAEDPLSLDQRAVEFGFANFDFDI